MEKGTQEKKATSKKTATASTAIAKAATAKNDAKETVINILVPTAESRIKKLENLQRLADRYQKLTAKRDDLDTFNVGVDNLHERLEIKNGKEVFTVSNSQVLAVILRPLLRHSFCNTWVSFASKFCPIFCLW
jgi:hypothetical protein